MLTKTPRLLRLMFLVPKRMTRYVLAELFTPTAIALMLYTFVLLMNHFFVIAEKALAKNLGLGLTLKLFLSGVPDLLVLSIPMAVLLGVMIAVGRMSADHEWVALQSVGQGPRRLIVPVFCFGLAAAIFSGYIYWFVSPRAQFAGRSLRGEVLVASNLASDLKPGVFYSGLTDLVLFVRDIRSSPQRKLQGVVLVRRDRQAESTVLIVAKEGDLYPSPTVEGDLVGDFYGGVYHQFDFRSGETYRYQAFEDFREQIAMNSILPEVRSPSQKTPGDMDFEELHALFAERLDNVRALEADVAGPNPKPGGEQQLKLARRLLMMVNDVYQSRIALPFACLLFAMLALPLGVTRARSGKGAGFAWSFLIILIYWLIFTVARNQAVAQKIPGWLSPWVANIALTPWALFALWRMHGRSRGDSGPLSLVGRALRGLRRGIVTLGSKLRLRRTEAAQLVDEAESEEGAIPLGDLSGTSSRFIGRFDSYVIKTFMRILGLAMLAAYVIFGLVEFKNLTGDMVRGPDTTELMLRYFLVFAPGALNIILPVACLIAAVTTFTLLTRTGELTAAKASGISMRRATVPVLALTLIASALLYVVDDRIAPVTNQQAQTLEDQITGRAPRTHGNPINGHWSFGPEGKTLYHYERFDSRTDLYEGMAIFTIDEQNGRILDHRYAETARWNGRQWELDGGWYRDFPTDATARTYETYSGVEVAEFEPPESMRSAQFSLNQLDKMTQEMTLAQIRKEIDTRTARNYNTVRLQVQYYMKSASAVAPLVMVLLGLPFAFKVGRKGSMYGIGVALLLVLVYWATFAIFKGLGTNTLLTPLIAAWGPNILFSLIGFYMLLYVKT